MLPIEVRPFQITAPALDRLGRPMYDLRVSVVDTCNFRCPYCMPEELVDAAPTPRVERLDFEQIERVVRASVELGVRKVRLTGGEPLLRKRLPDLVTRLAAIEGIEDLALTTNGVLLPAHAQTLADAGLSRVTLSLDAVDEAVFARMSGGRGNVAQVLAGLEAAERAGLGPIKINAVVIRGYNDHVVLPLLEHFRGTPHIVRLIEYMDVGNVNGWNRGNVLSTAELLSAVQSRWPLKPLRPAIRGEVAKRYAYADGQGEIGFISSISQPFCGDCSRARLSTDGRLFTCLFAKDGIDLKPALDGNDEHLLSELSGVWSVREDRYSEIRSTLGNDRKVEMYEIGG